MPDLPILANFWQLFPCLPNYLTSFFSFVHNILHFIFLTDMNIEHFLKQNYKNGYNSAETFVPTD